MGKHRSETKQCQNPKCNKEFSSIRGARFCSRSCANSFTNLGKIRDEESRLKTSEAVKRYYAEHPAAKAQPKAVEQGARISKGKFNGDPKSLIEFSKRTVSKVFKRLGVGCSRCGWNEATCDVHHIGGRKIDDPHNHENLTYLCPNCHRLFHCGKIGPSDVINLNVFIGDKWKEVYYG